MGRDGVRSAARLRAAAAAHPPGAGRGVRGSRRLSRRRGRRGVADAESRKSVSVPVGALHTFRNRSGGVVRVRNWHRPAMRFEDFIESTCRTLRAAGITRRRDPRALLYLSMVMLDFEDTLAPGRLRERLPMQLLAGIARRLRGVESRPWRSLACTRSSLATTPPPTGRSWPTSWGSRRSTPAGAGPSSRCPRRSWPRTRLGGRRRL